MRIYLARHGQSEWQIQASRERDTNLTSIGHEQSRLLARWLADHKQLDGAVRLEVAALCASPYRRAQDTAAYASEALRLTVCTYPSLREADFHVADDLPATARPLEAHGAYIASSRYAGFKVQVRAGLEQLVARAEAAHGPVLAVTHGGFMKTLLRLVAGTDTVCFQLYNTALSAIEWRRGRWHLTHLNLWDHLPAELRTW